MRSTLLALGVLVGVGTVSNAAPINVPVPTNAYIVQNGLDWAWASPLPAFIGDLSNPPNNGLDLSFQSQFGWGIPTFAQLVMAPLATAFLFPDGNVPFGVFFSGGTRWSRSREWSLFQCHESSVYRRSKRWRMCDSLFFERVPIRNPHTSFAAACDCRTIAIYEYAP